jgi:hypothetical protein
VVDGGYKKSFNKNKPSSSPKCSGRAQIGVVWGWGIAEWYQREKRGRRKCGGESELGRNSSPSLVTSITQQAVEEK